MLACAAACMLALWLGATPASAAQKPCGLQGGPVCPPPAPIISPWRYDIYPNFSQPWSGWRESESAAIAYIPQLFVQPGSICAMNYATKHQKVGQTYIGGILTFDSWLLEYHGLDYDCASPFNMWPDMIMEREVSCPPGSSLQYTDPTIAAHCAPALLPDHAPLDPLKAQGRSCPSNAATAGSGKTTRGNPCDVSNGNKYQSEVDYVGGGENPLKFVRSYNSFSAYYVGSSHFTNSKAPYGPQSIGVAWTATYFQRLRRVTATASTDSFDTIYAVRPDGRVLQFNLYGGVFVPDADVPDTVAVVGADYEYRTDDDTVETYDSTGRLTSIQQRGQRPHTLTYSGDALRPSAVTDGFGHTLTFNYATLGGDTRLQSITDPAGNSIVYTYGVNGSLDSVTYPDSTSRSYTYGYTGWTLTGITDESSVAFAAWTYSTGGNFVVSSSRAGGVEEYSFTYGTGNRTVTDPLGTVRTINQAMTQKVYRATGTDQPCAACGSQQSAVYDGNGNVTASTDFSGVVTEYEYDLDRNLETGRTEAVGAAVERIVTTDWDSTFRLPSLITEPGRSTGFTYDGDGNLLTRTITDTATSATRIWTYTYNGYGQVLTENGPRTDVSDVTTYTYYGDSASCTATVSGASAVGCRGQLSSVTNALSHVTTLDEYNAHGQPLKITDPNGLVTTLTYDLRQRVTSRTVGVETTCSPTGRRAS